MKLLSNVPLISVTPAEWPTGFWAPANGGSLFPPEWPRSGYVYPDDEPAAEPPDRRAASVAVLDADDRAALASLPMTVRELGSDEVIAEEGDRPSHSCLILEEFAYRYKMADDGRRQIFSFHVPGDIPDLQSLYLETMDHALAALSAAKIGLIQHSHLQELCFRHPKLGAVFWRDTLIDGAVFREWMMGIGRQDAPTKVAHLLCEMYVRLRRVGMASGNSVRLPITQDELGDALGLSTVHVNRSLQSLRRDGLIEFGRGVLTILNCERLKVAAEFDASYLHLHPVPDRTVAA